jgi:hypothetical protein
MHIIYEDTRLQNDYLLSCSGAAVTKRHLSWHMLQKLGELETAYLLL